MNSIKKNFDVQMVRLPIDILKVDLYQKRVREHKVKSIVSEFNPVSLGLIHVSLREDGTYWIMDGQHRTEGLRRMGVKYVDCLVFTGLSYEDEASGFVGHHNISKPTKIEEHKARVEAKEQTALNIERITNSIGLRIVAGGMTDTIQSVTTLYNIYESNGEKILTDVLTIVKEGFPNTDRPYSVAILKSVRDILVEYGSKVDKKWLIQKLKQEDYNNLNNKADAFVKVYGFNRVKGMEMAITQCYNHRKSERLKLI